MVSRKINVVFYLAILGLLFFSSCKAGKKATSDVRVKERSSKYVVKRLNQNKVDVEWLNGKGKLFYKDSEQSLRASVTIRMRKDSAIWMAVKKFGIEGARVLITTDSLYVLDRLSKVYYVKDFDFIEREYNLPASFTELQNLLLGNPVLLSDKKYQSELEKTAHLLSDEVAGVQQKYWIDGGRFLLDKMSFVEPAERREVLIEQSDFQSLDKNTNFSYFRNLKLNSPTTGNVNMELTFSKVEINEATSMRFSVPSNYTLAK